MQRNAFVTSAHSLRNLVGHSRQCRPHICSRRMRTSTTRQFSPVMALRAVENFDGSFVLDQSVKEILENRLTEDQFVKYVASQGKCESVEFTGILFQPVPYSKTTPRGMPADVEPYASDGQYMLINIPPKVMFDARCFKPSRLCAVYKRIAVSADALAEHAEKEKLRIEEIAMRAKELENDDLWAGLGTVIQENFHEKEPEDDSDLDAMVV